jgi:AraC family transcriptional regulator
MTTPRSLLIAVCMAFLSAHPAWAELPTGWLVAGSAPNDYEFSRDTSTAQSGQSSALIAAKSGITSSGFGTLMQTIDADNYRGARWRMSCYLKTRDVAKAQMWMRVDGPDRKILSFDNMDSRPVRGTTPWTRYEIVLDVPADSIDIAFGFFLTQGGGKVWGDNFKFEKVDSTVPVTAPASVAPARPKEPINADFES